MKSLNRRVRSWLSAIRGWRLWVATLSCLLAAASGTAAPFDTFVRLPQIVVDPQNMQVDIDKDFVINVDFKWVSPHLRARVFKGSLTELRNNLVNPDYQEGCIVYDSLVISSQSHDSALRFTRLDPEWRARDRSSEVFVVVFEISAGPTPGPVKLLPVLVGEYFLNGYQISTPKATGAPKRMERLDSRDPQVRAQARHVKCIESLVNRR